MGTLKSAAMAPVRARLAASFYAVDGISPVKALEHIEGINFKKPVEVVTLKKGTVVQQWVGEKGVGNYFTPLENGSSKNLGISYEGRELKQFTLTEDVNVLKSTAADYKGHTGGGTQYFSSGIKSKAVPKK